MVAKTAEFLSKIANNKSAIACIGALCGWMQLFGWYKHIRYDDMVWLTWRYLGIPGGNGAETWLDGHHEVVSVALLILAIAGFASLISTIAMEVLREERWNGILEGAYGPMTWLGLLLASFVDIPVTRIIWFFAAFVLAVVLVSAAHALDVEQWAQHSTAKALAIAAMKGVGVYGLAIFGDLFAPVVAVANIFE
jgi:hypothetical protein